MKGGGGGWESKMKTKSWCSNCQRLSAMMVSTAPPSPSSSISSWRGVNSLLKVAMSLAMLVLLFSIYQTCVSSHESSLPLWLSLSFVSPPSFLSSPELPKQPQERSTSRLENPSSLERASKLGDSGLSVTDMDSSQYPIHWPLQSTSTSDVGSSSVEKDLPEEKMRLVEDPHQISNLSDSTSPPTVEKDEIDEGETTVLSETTSIEESNSNSSELSSASVEKNDFPQSESGVLSEITTMEGANSKSRDISSSSSVERDEVKESRTMIITETTLDESVKDGEANEGKISEDEQHGMVGLSNSSPGTKSEANAAVPSDNSASGDHVSAHAPAAPYIELAIPSHNTEKSMDERRVKLDEQLYAAKQAIEGATLADKDPSLYGVIFHNVSAFSKSYKLMEEMFKIYVYKDGNPPLVHTGPLKGIYASEGRFIDRISKGSPFVVEDPAEAYMFYLPYSVTQMTLTIYVEGSPSMQPLNDFIKDYVDQVAAKYPFWNRTRGADHFFVSCHDWGPATARDHEELRKNAVKVVCNADLNEGYVLGKDVSLPETYLYYTSKPLKVGGPGAVRRSFLAFFAGQMHGHVRPILIEHWKDKDPDMKIYEVLPKAIERKMNYVQHMKNSKYCICAAGFEVNSPRIVESIYYDCVPVIIADNFILPFSDVLNWSTFSVTIPESEIPNLKSILLSISDRQYKAMQKRLSTVRQHFLWHDEPVKYDVFHMIMHSVWISRLNRLNP